MTVLSPYTDTGVKPMLTLVHRMEYFVTINAGANDIYSVEFQTEGGSARAPHPKLTSVSGPKFFYLPANSAYGFGLNITQNNSGAIEVTMREKEIQKKNDF